MALRVIPCAPGAHIGEQITLGFLKQNLSNGVILTNYHQPDQTGTLEIDLAVINYQGVWLLEVKHWWGRIDADSIHWLHAGRKHPSPLTTIESKAKVVHSTLSKAGLEYVSVVGLVILSKGTGTLQIDDPRADRVFGLNEALIQALTSRDFVFSRRSMILKRSQVDRIKDILARKYVDPDWQIVGSYRLVDRIGSGEHYEAFEGQHTHVQSRRARVKRYHIEAIQSRKHLEESVRRFKQDIEALAQLEGHPNIIQAYDFLSDPDTDDTYWLLLEYVDGVTLRDFLDEGREMSLEEQISILIPVADALSFCHQEDILHRNLTPRAIYVTEAGDVKVGDFDFARVPTLGFTISQTGHPLVQNKYIAPEQLADPRTADYRADLYSLGAIFYELTFRPPADEPILMHRIESSSLPVEACNLMCQMLSTRPSERPKSAAAVKECFELLKE